MSYGRVFAASKGFSPPAPARLGRHPAAPAQTRIKTRLKTRRKTRRCRLVNVFSSSDFMLGVVYRATAMTTGVAGLRPMQAPGVENVNATSVLKGFHRGYPKRLPELMALVG